MCVEVLHQVLVRKTFGMNLMIKKERTKDKAERWCQQRHDDGDIESDQQDYSNGHLSSNNNDSNDFNKMGSNYSTFVQQLFKKESSITSKFDQIYVDREFVDIMYLIDIISWCILHLKMKISVLLTYNWHFLQSIIILIHYNISCSINYCVDCLCKNVSIPTKLSYSQSYVVFFLFCFSTSLALLYYSLVKK